MKKQWTKPQAIVEQFMPNEYVASCKYYNLTCRGFQMGGYKYCIERQNNNVLQYQGDGNSYPTGTLLDEFQSNTIGFYDCAKEDYVLSPDTELQFLWLLEQTDLGNVESTFVVQWSANGVNHAMPINTYGTGSLPTVEVPNGNRS